MLLVLVACAHKAASVPKPPAAPSTVITLERKTCYGTCPVYLLTVTEGGVVFEGRQHVDSVGTFTAHIDAGRFAALVRLFDEKQFFALDDRYVYGVPSCQPYAADAPIVIVSLTSNGRAKRVEHDAGCVGVPARLGEIERQIDEMVGTARWIRRGA
jgi:hypothetical protein